MTYYQIHKYEYDQCSIILSLILVSLVLKGVISTFKVLNRNILHTYKFITIALATQYYSHSHVLFENMVFNNSKNQNLIKCIVDI